MNRKDFYFRELVTEDDINNAFTYAEQADRNFTIDSDFKQKTDGSGVALSTPAGTDFNALLGGITSGLQVSISGTSATVTGGVAYDGLGQRIAVPTSTTISLAVTGDTAIGQGGTPTGVGSVSTTPASTQFIWILLQVYFNRLLTDPREDGNDATIYFDEAESFQFRVKASTSSATPSQPGGDPNCVILGLFKINASNVITTQDYSTRGDWIRSFSTYTTGPLPTAQTEDGTTTDSNFIQGTARNAILKLRNSIGLAGSNYANHINQSAPQDRHAAKNIDFDATSANWADGTSPAIASNLGGGVDTDGVQSAINQIIALISDATPGGGGTKKLGGAAISGSPVTISSGTIRLQLQNLLDGINNHLNNTTGAHAASAISVAPGTILTGNNVANQLAQIDALRFASPFGNGGDGDVSLGSGTTTLSRDMVYNNLTLASGAALYTNSFVIRVKGTLTLTDSTSILFADSPNQLNAASGFIVGSGSKALSAGSVSGGASGGGGAGAPGLNTSNSLGGLGGAGGASGGAGGTGAGFASTFSPINVSLYFPGMVYTRTGTNEATRSFGWIPLEGGTGGGTGNPGTGGEGYGGAGGGILCVLANNVVYTSNASFKAPGGNGANNASGGGGGGGGGGVVLFWYASKTGPSLSSSVSCLGGTGGTGTTGAGVTGTAGQAIEINIGLL